MFTTTKDVGAPLVGTISATTTGSEVAPLPGAIEEQDILQLVLSPLIKAMIIEGIQNKDQLNQDNSSGLSEQQWLLTKEIQKIIKAVKNKSSKKLLEALENDRNALNKTLQDELDKLVNDVIVKISREFNEPSSNISQASSVLMSSLNLAAAAGGAASIIGVYLTGGLATIGTLAGGGALIGLAVTIPATYFLIKEINETNQAYDDAFKDYKINKIAWEMQLQELSIEINNAKTLDELIWLRAKLANLSKNNESALPSKDDDINFSNTEDTNSAPDDNSSTPSPTSLLIIPDSSSEDEDDENSNLLLHQDEKSEISKTKLKLQEQLKKIAATRLTPPNLLKPQPFSDTATKKVGLMATAGFLAGSLTVYGIASTVMFTLGMTLALSNPVGWGILLGAIVVGVAAATVYGYRQYQVEKRKLLTNQVMESTNLFTKDINSIQQAKQNNQEVGYVAKLKQKNAALAAQFNVVTQSKDELVAEKETLIKKSQEDAKRIKELEEQNNKLKLQAQKALAQLPQKSADLTAQVSQVQTEIPLSKADSTSIVIGKLNEGVSDADIEEKVEINKTSSVQTTQPASNPAENQNNPGWIPYLASSLPSFNSFNWLRTNQAQPPLQQVKETVEDKKLNN